MEANTCNAIHNTATNGNKPQEMTMSSATPFHKALVLALATSTLVACTTINPTPENSKPATP